jgi:hypothetical protein
MQAETQSQRELAKYKSGEWTLQQLADCWAHRTFDEPDIPKGWDAEGELGGDGTWHEILKMALTGKLDWDDFIFISREAERVNGQPDLSPQARKIVSEE